MKTRYSLVSNSSTTSFCIYGISVERLSEDSIDELFKLIQKFQQSFPDEYKDYITKQILYYTKQLVEPSKYQDSYQGYLKVFKELLNIQNLTLPPAESEHIGWKDMFDSLCGIIGLSIHSNYDAGLTWIGRSYRSIKDYETGKQFKDSVSNSLKKLFDDCECSTYEEAWRDG